MPIHDIRSRSVGFDLGGTKMLATVYDSDFTSLARRKRKTRGHEGFEAGLTRTIQTIDDALERSASSRSQLMSIGIGSVGALDLNRGVILEAPNLGWRDAPLAESLEQEFGCPVVVGNDVDMGLFAEWKFGAARGARCALGVFPGTGIGGACVYQGEVLRGTTGSCMELGHVPVMRDGPRCGCGKTGCLEAVAARLPIAAAAAQAAFRGEAPNLLRMAGADLSRITSKALGASVRAGDAAVELIVREAARWIGEALAGAVHLLAPEVVVLGGGLVEAMPELFLGEVSHAARNRVLPSFRDSFRIATAELGDDSIVLGAAAWARRKAARAAA